MSEPFVVKAQIALFQSHGSNSCLLYDNNREVEHTQEVDDDTAKEIGPRSFWWAIIDDAGVINLQTKSNEAEYEQFSYGVMNGKH